MISSTAQAHDNNAKATYLANAAVLISNAETKVLFDPFFHKNFGIYQMVKKQTQQAIFAGLPPFDNLTAIVISHAHDDHFSAADVFDYLNLYPSTKLIGPKQAIDEIMQLPNAKSIAQQLVSVELALREPAKQLQVAKLTIEVVRIPHAGWPARANIENMVFRVTLNSAKQKAITIMHMGDADPDDDHYLVHKQHWQSRASDTAFLPYWFYFSAEGNDILTEVLNVNRNIGVHVPVNVPNQLKRGEHDYFSQPGETRIIQRH